MAHIYIHSPSSSVRDKAAFKRGVARLITLGHDVELDPNALSHHQRFAGDDDTRLAAIGRAAASGAISAQIASTSHAPSGASINNHTPLDAPPSEACTTSASAPDGK